MNWLQDLLTGNNAVDQKVGALIDVMERLRARESDVRAELEMVVLQPGKAPREEVRDWLKNVERKTCEVQSIVKCNREKGFFSSNWQLIRCISSITKEVECLLRYGSFPHGLVLFDPKSMALPFPYAKPLGKMFQENAEKIMRWLEIPEKVMIGVYGFGGVGKTTLLQCVHNQLIQHPYISWLVIWISVSQDFGVHKLQDEIARKLDLQLCEDDEKQRAAILCTRLAAVAPVVLFLDDLPSPFSSVDVGIPLESNGCKIIMSTLSKQVCDRMGCNDCVIEAQTLPKDDAWELFVNELENYDSLAEDVKQVAKEVAEECGGLPLAIYTMARCMRGKVEIGEWKNALIALQRPTMGEDDFEDWVVPRLQCSYERLNDKMEQNCFLSCILYPAYQNLRATDIIELWINEGLLDEIGCREHQVKKGFSVLRTLEKSCLLTLTTDRFGKECVKLHNLIRYMAISITKNHPRFISEPGLQLTEVPKREEWNEDLVKVSLRENFITEIQCNLSPKCPKLLVLMLSQNPLKVIPDSLFVHMKALRVLDLSWTCIERLPDSVSHLEDLRELALEGCAELVYVPSVAKLTKLRGLNLPCNEKLRAAPEGMDNLYRSLEKLHCCWSRSDLTYSKCLCMLRSFEIWFHGESNTQSDLDQYKGLDVYDKKLVIRGGKFGLEEPISLPCGIHVLSVHGSDLRSHSLGEIFPLLHRATEFRMLVLQDCGGLEYISSLVSEQVSSNVCRQLNAIECLVLHNLHDMKGLIESPGDKRLSSASSFFHLKKLHICGCPKIKVVFQLTNYRRSLFPSLETVRVENCESLEGLYEASVSDCSLFSSPCGKRESDDANGINPNPIFALPQLRKLKLLLLPKLGSIYRGLILCTALEELSIDVCPKLKRLELPKHMICDASPSTLASFPAESDNSEWWKPLNENYPQGTPLLSKFICSFQRKKYPRSHEPAVPSV